jgi:uncharacterized membrane protein
LTGTIAKNSLNSEYNDRSYTILSYYLVLEDLAGNMILYSVVQNDKVNHVVYVPSAVKYYVGVIPGGDFCTLSYTLILTKVTRTHFFSRSR